MSPTTSSSSSAQASPLAAADVAALHSRLRFRQYTAADHATVVTLFAEGMRSYAGHQGEGNLRYIQWSLETDLADIHGTYITPGGNFWIASLASETTAGDEAEPEEVIGMIACQPKAEGDGELRRLSVKSAYRRFGIGKILVRHLERWATANGFKTVSLNTGTVMHDACLFYKKIGYTLTKTEHTSGHYELAFFCKQLLDDEASFANRA
ncbi:N-acetyltransferase cml2 [Globisporangium polare]